MKIIMDTNICIYLIKKTPPNLHDQLKQKERSSALWICSLPPMHSVSTPPLSQTISVNSGAYQD